MRVCFSICVYMFETVCVFLYVCVMCLGVCVRLCLCVRCLSKCV